MCDAAAHKRVAQFGEQAQCLVCGTTIATRTAPANKRPRELPAADKLTSWVGGAVPFWQWDLSVSKVYGSLHETGQRTGVRAAAEHAAVIAPADSDSDAGDSEDDETEDEAD